MDIWSIQIGMNSWDAIEKTALSLGVKPDAVRKWRVRGVPRRWRFDLVRADVRREIDPEVFDRPPGPKRPRASAEAA